jgi:hypothetical protein
LKYRSLSLIDLLAAKIIKTDQTYFNYMIQKVNATTIEKAGGTFSPAPQW